MEQGNQKVGDGIMDKHDEIANRVAEIFASNAYVHVKHQGHEWAIGVDTVEMTVDSLKKAMSLALSAFAREYGLETPIRWDKGHDHPLGGFKDTER
jgi:hypothetical protein